MLTHNTIGRNGRLGNQMFQYASLRGISFWNDLDYAIPAVGHHLFECFEMEGVIAGTSASYDTVTFNEPHYHFDPNFMSGFPDGRDLFGYFQSEKYFEHIESEIRKDFRFKKHIMDAAEPYTRILRDNKVFSIHFRRTDYLNTPDAHPVPAHSFYKKAIKIFNDYDYGLVFSDDIEWCKTLDYLQSDKFIFCSNHAYLDLYLMTQCHSNVIANSSFSWWGAWLNSGSDKMVLTPSIWFGPAINADTKDLIPEDWIIIK